MRKERKALAGGGQRGGDDGRLDRPLRLEQAGKRRRDRQLCAGDQRAPLLRREAGRDVAPAGHASDKKRQRRSIRQIAGGKQRQHILRQVLGQTLDHLPARAGRTLRKRGELERHEEPTERRRLLAQILRRIHCRGRAVAVLGQLQEFLLADDCIERRRSRLDVGTRGRIEHDTGAAIDRAPLGQRDASRPEDELGAHGRPAARCEEARGARGEFRPRPGEMAAASQIGHVTTLQPGPPPLIIASPAGRLSIATVGLG